MDFKNIPSKYRPVPFWSWNEKLNTEETKIQIERMHDAGIGGFFMHARGGLQTEYMGEEWFENITAGIDKAKELDMHAWAYDENGWPSGFGGGKVNGKGEKYWQKYLRMGKAPAEEHRVIAQYEDICFYYDVNPFYVDTLDAEVTADFIREIYEPYYERFGAGFDGFFTDEPQISRNGIPWSLTLPKQYELRYGEDLCAVIQELFMPVGAYKETRVKFWKMICELFSENFMKQIYDWCESHGLQFTGHLVCEETFESQLISNGAAMPHYEYFSIPGMDCLCRDIITDLTSYQLGSAAQQLGKKQVLSETFALCGHNVSFDELKAIYEHQMIHGINLLCQHLEGYSLRGIRKRDYPPAMYYQQPWWPKYERFCTTMSRIGMILAEGECECDTLLLHPQTSAWILFDGGKNEGLNEFYKEFKQIVNDFDRKHILFHLGDEILMERHGKVEGDRLIIGNMAYRTVVIPNHIMFLENTERLLNEFKENGGNIVTADQIEARNDVVDNPEIIYTKRKFDEYDVYYFLNPTKEKQTAKIGKGEVLIDEKTGEIIPFSGVYKFAPCESILVKTAEKKQEKEENTNLKTLDLGGEWKLESVSPNLLTLDFCDYYFDDILQEEHGYVLNIQNRAMKLERPVMIRQEYHVELEMEPDDISLLCETPEIFEIKVNDITVCEAPQGWMIDTAFKKIDISTYLKKGSNTITMTTCFKQPDKVYESLKKASVFESEINKLTYDMEIEPCYLAGNFAVRMDGKTENLERDAFRFTGEFVLCPLPETVTLQEIEKQGFCFFAGDMVVSRHYNLEDTEYQLHLKKKGINVVDAAINGKDAGNFMFAGDKTDCSNLFMEGDNIVTLHLYNNLRNMLGPHHVEEGELYAVGPGVFFKEVCIWGPWAGQVWNDGYCFVEMSIS